MSKLDELIAQLCPDGVEYKLIKEVYTRIKGTPITAGKMKEIESPDGEIRIFAGGRTVINAHEGDIPKANITRVPALLVQSRGIIDFVYYEEPFTFKNEMWAYTHKEKVSVKYLFYVLKNNVEYFREAASGMGSLPQISLSVTEDYVIPVPPLEVQREIVRMLDNFTELTGTLEREYVLRNRQYRGYSRRLFEKIIDSAPRKTMGELCTITKGSSPIQKTNPGVYPMVVTTTERKTSDEYQFDSPAVCVPLVSSRGHGVACLNHVYYQEGKFALGNILCAVQPKLESRLNAKFLYYYLEETKDYLLVPLMKGGANVSLHIEDIEKVKVPVPSAEIQERTVHTLELFDKLCNSTETGLPAEITARQKQYEYYRDKLLTFKELQP